MASYKEIIDIDIEDFLNLDKVALKNYVSYLGNVVNRRVKMLKARGYNTPATKKAPISVKGKNLNQLRSEFIRAKDILSQKTSSVRGAKKVEKNFLNRVGLGNRFGTFTAPLRDRFWDIYNKFIQMPNHNADALNGGSFELQRMLARIIERHNPRFNFDDDMSKFHQSHRDSNANPSILSRDLKEVMDELEEAYRDANRFYNKSSGFEDYT